MLGWVYVCACWKVRVWVGGGGYMYACVSVYVDLDVPKVMF